MRWGPRWDPSEGVLVFDGASGDFWVLSAGADLVLRAIDGAGDLASVDVAGVEDGTSIADLVAGLRGCGLICRTE